MSTDAREADLQSKQSDDTMARDLAAFGPLMRQQDRIEAEGVNSTFAAELRSRLMSLETQTADPRFASNLRERSTSVKVARPSESPRMARGRLLPSSRSVSPRWVLAAIAALLVLVAQVAQPGGLPRLGFTPPYPSRSDLTFTYPPVRQVIHRLKPTVSLIHPSRGLAFAGHLRLTASKVPAQPPILRTYRLASLEGTGTFGRRLHIRGLERRVVSGGTTWLEAVDGGGRSHRPMHSVAVSTKTGELIYHDRRNFRLVFTKRALPRPRAVRIARRWLSGLGWAAAQMPLTSFGSVQGRPKVRRIAFGWPGVGRTAADEATLWLTPNGSVVEAWAWPPVAQTGIVYARDVSAAWSDVQSARATVAVKGIYPRVMANGSGTLHKTEVVSVLSLGSGGGMFLVPAFQFGGSAHFQGKSRVHHWFALVPAEAR